MKVRIISRKYDDIDDMIKAYPTLSEPKRQLYRRWRVDGKDDKLPYKKAEISMYTIEDLCELSKEIDAPITVNYDIYGNVVMTIND